MPKSLLCYLLLRLSPGKVVWYLPVFSFSRFRHIFHFYHASESPAKVVYLLENTAASTQEIRGHPCGTVHTHHVRQYWHNAQYPPNSCPLLLQCAVQSWGLCTFLPARNRWYKLYWPYPLSQLWNCSLWCLDAQSLFDGSVPAGWLFECQLSAL